LLTLGAMAKTTKGKKRVLEDRGFSSGSDHSRRQTESKKKRLKKLAETKVKAAQAAASVKTPVNDKPRTRGAAAAAAAAAEPAAAAAAAPAAAAASGNNDSPSSKENGTSPNDLEDTPLSKPGESANNAVCTLFCAACGSEKNEFSKNQKKKWSHMELARCKLCIGDEKPAKYSTLEEARAANQATDAASISDRETPATVEHIAVPVVRPLCPACEKPILLEPSDDPNVSAEPYCACGKVALSRMVKILEGLGVSFPEFLAISAELAQGIIGPSRKALMARFVAKSVEGLTKRRNDYIDMMTKVGGLPSDTAETMWNCYGVNHQAETNQHYVDKVENGHKHLKHIENMVERFIFRAFGYKRNGSSTNSSSTSDSSKSSSSESSCDKTKGKHSNPADESDGENEFDD
jgi:hypothetical protein